MRFIRFQLKDQSSQNGWLYHDNKKGDQVGVIQGNIFAEFTRKKAHIPIGSVTLLPPVQPSKIICVGRNYIAHAEEHGAKVPEIPLIFLKPPSSIIGPGETINLPPQSQQVEHEAELAVVIGLQGRWIQAEEANSYILGYTIANDVTARDLQRRDNQWSRAKGFDTFCPVGPWIETDFNSSDVMITCHVNGELRQMSSTRDMVFNVSNLIAFTSSIMTLEPGDIILTGTPAGVGPLLPRDIVEVKIDGLGVLQNPVKAEQAG